MDLRATAVVFTGTLFFALVVVLLEVLVAAFLADFLVDDLVAWVVVSPCSSRVTAVAARTVRNRVIAGLLRNKQSLSYMKLRVTTETNILHYVAARGQVRAAIFYRLAQA